ncbi:MAG: hypothetical protein V4543_14240 [Bacteroidota bacterium]
MGIITERLTTKAPVLKAGKSTLPVNWLFRTFEPGISSEDSINAYLFENRYVHAFQRTTFISNLLTASGFALNFLKALDAEKGIKCLSVFIKAADLRSFELLLTVDVGDFVSEEFVSAYKLARESKAAVNTDSFNLTISFLPNSDQLDAEALICDGFTWHYEQK